MVHVYALFTCFDVLPNVRDKNLIYMYSYRVMH